MANQLERDTGAQTGLPSRALGGVLGVLALVIILAPAASATPLSGANADLNKFCTVQGSTYADDTTDANSASASDITLGDNVLAGGADAAFFGMEEPFTTLYVNVGTAGTVGVQTWYYWSSLGTWSVLVATDNTNSFKTSGTNTVTWTPPSDWAETIVDGTNCAGSRYYVRALTTLVYTTIPRGTQVSAIEYNLRVKVQDELGTAVTGLGQSAFTVAAGTTNTIFAFRELATAGQYELALDTAGADVDFTVTAAKDGYVTSSTLATGSLTTTMMDKTGTPIALSFAFKVTGVTAEGPGTSLTSATVATGDSFGTSCTASGGAWYCAVPLANTGIAVRAAMDGYVTDTAASFASDRTAAGDAQRTVAVTNVRFAVKVTSVTHELGSALSSVTVLSGLLFDTTCTESGGAWYCAIPLADLGTSLQAAKDGYVTTTALLAFTDRTAATDAQRTATVSDVPFAYKVTSVADELSNSLSTVAVNAGNSAGTSCTESGGAWYCPVPLADTTLTIVAAKDGYVTNSDSSFLLDRTLAADTQKTGTVSNVRFALKVTSVADELSNSLSSLTVTAGDAAAVTCTASGGAWYCVLPLAHTSTDVLAAKDGYVTRTASSAFTDRTAATDAQRTATVTGVQFAFKVTGVTAEATGTSLTTSTVTTGDSFGTTCTASGGAWYCAVPLAESGLVIRAARDGYVTNSATSFGSDRTGASDAQVTAAVANVRYAFKVTGVSDELSNALSSVTVATGDLSGTSCSESGGAWYCPVPLSDVTLTIRAAKDGFVTNTGSSFAGDRTTAADAQVTATATGLLYAVKVTGVTDELSNALTGGTVTTGDSYGTTCTASGAAWYCAVPLADTGNDVRAAKDGYATKTSASAFVDRLLSTDGQRTASVSNVLFAYKVTGVADELGNALATVTVNAGDAAAVSCTESSGAWYCAVPLAHTTLTIVAAKDGYVSSSSLAFATDRTAATDSQVTKAVTGVLFAYKVTGITTEASASLTTVTVTTGDAFGVACTESSGAWYCAVPLAHTGVTVRAAKTGYVTDSATTFAADRTTATAAQGTVVVANVLYTVKLTATTESSWTGATLEKKVGAGSYATATPTTTLGNVAYVAQDPAEANIVFRATKYGVSLDTGAAFTASASSQAAHSLAFVGSLVGVSVTPASPLPLVQTTYVASFVTSHPWAPDGRLVVTFPTGYTIGSPSVTLSGADGTATASVAGLVVTITRANDGTAASAGAAISVTLTQVTNPAAGVTGTFAVEMRTNAGVAVDSGTAVALTIGGSSGGGGGGGGGGVSTTPAPTPSVTGLTSATHPSGQWTTVISFIGTWTSDQTVLGYSWAMDAQPDDTADGALGLATFAALADGSHAFHVKAQGLDGRWGTVASLQDIRVDTQPPATTASVPAPGNGPVLITWSSTDAGSGVARVDIYVAVVGSTPQLYHSTGTSSGTVAFNGDANTTYAFWVVSRDNVGNAEALGIPIGTALVLGGNVGAPPDVMEDLERLAQARNDKPLQALDTDGDGIPDALLDPTGALHLLRAFTIDGHPAFLVGAEVGPHMAIWIPDTATVLPVTFIVTTAEATEGPDGSLLLKFTVSKDGWIVVSVPDPGARRELLSVMREDGSLLPSDQAWRADTRVYVLDDPSRTYTVQLGPAPAGPWSPLGDRSTMWIIVGLILVGGVGAIIAWIAWPSVRSLRASPSRAAWVRRLRTCELCHDALPRLERFARSRHACVPPKLPIVMAAATAPSVFVPRLETRGLHDAHARSVSTHAPSAGVSPPLRKAPLPKASVARARK